MAALSSAAMGADESFKIKLNQNLWVLVVGYLSLGAADHYHLSWWFLWLARVVASVATISVLITLCFYTVNYCTDRPNVARKP
jgi:hypothetical protein